MSVYAHSPYRRPMFDDPTYDSEPSWRQDYYADAMVIPQQWPNSHSTNLSGIQHLDVRLFPDEDQHYSDLGYPQTDAWSDMDTVGSPSNSSYPNESPDPCFNPLPAPTVHLQLPEKSRHLLGLTSSPQSSFGSVSPVLSPMPMPINDQHSSMRAVPSPDRSRKAKNASHAGVVREIILGNDDAAYLPGSDPKRGRKRTRIPHTAVERRYRENLNAHLDKLRQTVPSLAARQGPDVGKASNGGESVKPSKCEILNGAIEHIGTLGRENLALKNEVTALRAKMGDIDQWYRANLR